MSSIPTAPYKSRNPLLGHLPCLLQIKKQERISLTAAVFLLIKRILKERLDIRLNGIFKIYLGPWPVVMVTSPEVAGLLLKRPNLQKSFMYKAFHVAMKGLVDMNGIEYQAHRKLLAPAFNLQILQSLPQIVAKRAAEFTSQVDKQIDCNNGIINDVTIPVIKTSMKVILSSAGVDYNVRDFADNVFDDEVVEDFLRIERLIADRYIQPWLLLNSLYPLFEYGRQADRALDRILRMAVNLFDAMKNTMRNQHVNNNIKKEATYMDILITENERSPEIFTKEDVLGEFKTFVAAGFDTVAAALTWTLHYLGHHPEVQEKICEQLEEVFGDSGRDITMEDIKRLQYLEAVAKEGLRISSPVPFFGRDADEDIVFQSNDGSDMTIPKSTSICIFPFFIHRDSRHWNDPEIFNPQRFLEDKKVLRHNHAFIPFSAGVRGCIGKKYAMIEVVAILSSVFRRFKIKSLNDLGSIRANPQVTLHPKDQVSIRFFRR